MPVRKGCGGERKLNNEKSIEKVKSQLGMASERGFCLGVVVARDSLRSWVVLAVLPVVS